MKYIYYFIFLLTRYWFIFVILFILFGLFFTGFLIFYDQILISFSNEQLIYISKNPYIFIVTSKLLNLLDLDNSENNHKILLLSFMVIFISLILGLLSPILIYCFFILVCIFIYLVYEEYMKNSYVLFNSSLFSIDRKLSYSEKKELFDEFVLKYYEDFIIWMGSVDFKIDIYPAIIDIHDPVLIEDILHELLLELNVKFVDKWTNPEINNIIVEIGSNQSSSLWFEYIGLFFIFIATIAFLIWQIKNPSDPNPPYLAVSSPTPEGFKELFPDIDFSSIKPSEFESLLQIINFVLMKVPLDSRGRLSAVFDILQAHAAQGTDILILQKAGEILQLLYGG